MASPITAVNLHAVPFNQGQIIAIRDIVNEYVPDAMPRIMEAILKVAEQGERRDLEFKIERKIEQLRMCLRDFPTNGIPKEMRKVVH